MVKFIRRRTVHNFRSTSTYSRIVHGHVITKTLRAIRIIVVRPIAHNVALCFVPRPKHVMRIHTLTDALTSLGLELSTRVHRARSISSKSLSELTFCNVNVTTARVTVFVFLRLTHFTRTIAPSSMQSLFTSFFALVCIQSVSDLFSSNAKLCFVRCC